MASGTENLGTGKRDGSAQDQKDNHNAMDSCGDAPHETVSHSM